MLSSVMFRSPLVSCAAFGLLVLVAQGKFAAAQYFRPHFGGDQWGSSSQNFGGDGFGYPTAGWAVDPPAWSHAPHGGGVMVQPPIMAAPLGHSFPVEQPWAGPVELPRQTQSALPGAFDSVVTGPLLDPGTQIAAPTIMEGYDPAYPIEYPGQSYQNYYPLDGGVVAPPVRKNSQSSPESSTNSMMADDSDGAPVIPSIVVPGQVEDRRDASEMPQERNQTSDKSDEKADASDIVVPPASAVFVPPAAPETNDDETSRDVDAEATTASVDEGRQAQLRKVQAQLNDARVKAREFEEKASAIARQAIESQSQLKQAQADLAKSKAAIAELESLRQNSESKLAEAKRKLVAAAALTKSEQSAEAEISRSKDLPADQQASPASKDDKLPPNIEPAEARPRLIEGAELPESVKAANAAAVEIESRGAKQAIETGSSTPDRQRLMVGSESSDESEDAASEPSSANTALSETSDDMAADASEPSGQNAAVDAIATGKMAAEVEGKLDAAAQADAQAEGEPAVNLDAEPTADVDGKLGIDAKADVETKQLLEKSEAAMSAAGVTKRAAVAKQEAKLDAVLQPPVDSSASKISSLEARINSLNDAMAKQTDSSMKRIKSDFRTKIEQLSVDGQTPDRQDVKKLETERDDRLKSTRKKIKQRYQRRISRLRKEIAALLRS